MLSASNSLLALVLTVLFTGITPGHAQEKSESKINGYLEELAIKTADENRQSIDKAFEKSKAH